MKFSAHRFAGCAALRRRTVSSVAAILLALLVNASGQDFTIRMAVEDAALLRFSVAGPAGVQALVEWSTNLTDWAADSVFELEGSDAPVVFSQSPLPDRAFYRARRLAPALVSNPTNIPPCILIGPPDQPSVRNAAIPNPFTPIKTLRLFIHVLAETDGSGQSASEALVEQQILLLNDQFRAHRIQFVHQFEVVSNSAFRHLANSSLFAGLRQAYSTMPATTLNVFVTGLPNTDNEEAVGDSVFPWDTSALSTNGGVLISETWFQAGLGHFTHELGHALGLWHTHRGLESGTACGPCWERADGLNGDTTGDLCPDTPPGRISIGCGYEPGFDFCSSNNWPTTGLNNFMSQYPDCSGRFTPQQAGRMHAWINYALSGWLDTNTPAAPSELTVKASTFGEVLLTWADNAWNETGFVIERAIGAGPFVTLATLAAGVTEFLDLTAPASTNCFYRVRAINGSASSYQSAPVVVSTPPAPCIIFADFNNTTPPFDGTVANPYPIVTAAYDSIDASCPTVIRIQTGVYPQSLFMSNKVLRLEPLNGPVLLGTQ